MSSLEEYFNAMSEIAHRYESRGDIANAQKTRDIRNNRWESDTRWQTYYQQVQDNSRSWR
jgi:hypothetical protein